MTKLPLQKIFGLVHMVSLHNDGKVDRKNGQSGMISDKRLERSHVNRQLQYDKVDIVITSSSPFWQLMSEESQTRRLNQVSLPISSTSCLNVGRSSGLQQQQAMLYIG